MSGKCYLGFHGSKPKGVVIALWRQADREAADEYYGRGVYEAAASMPALEEWRWQRRRERLTGGSASISEEVGVGGRGLGSSSCVLELDIGAVLEEVEV